MVNKDSIQIITSALNNMKLDEMIQIDRSRGSSEISVLQDRGEVSDKTTGLFVPFITINGYSITNFLRKFRLDLSGFMPTIRFSFTAAESVFISVNYPKDGDIVSVYMRSPGDYYKPFRMDFNILEVVSETSNRNSDTGVDPEGRGINLRFTIIAECRIPGLYTQRMKAFSYTTSYDCLFQVSQDLNLGFASNESITNDSMTWICPNYSYYDFIKDVCQRAYKDDRESFFDCWIDSYYNLNFVNFGTQFSFKGDPEVNAFFIPGVAAGGFDPASAIPGTPDGQPTSEPLVLNNQIGYGRIPYYVIGYTLTSRAGSNTNEMGYITEIGFYDETLDKENPEDKVIQYTIESQTTDNVKVGQILQKGRARGDEYKQEKRFEWLGVLNAAPTYKDGGVHENFLHARYQNIINLNDVTKLTLEIEIGNYFPGIYRGQVIPVIIYVNEGNVRKQNVGGQKNREANTTQTPVIDDFLTGNYVVLGMEVNWDMNQGRMKQKLTLGKREWTANTSGSLPKAFPISPLNKIF